MQRSIPAPDEYRSPEYDKWMAYYDREFHNKPPNELSEKRMRLKLRLREWLNQEQTKRRKPRLIQGFLPKGHQFEIQRRFRIEDSEGSSDGR